MTVTVGQPTPETGKILRRQHPARPPAFSQQHHTGHKQKDHAPSRIFITTMMLARMSVQVKATDTAARESQAIYCPI
jgi:hypothetical protein